MSCQEFPELTPEAKKSLLAGYKAAFPWHKGFKENWSEPNRKGQAAFLRKVINQAYDKARTWEECWDVLNAIADNLHSPPPPPPTLAQARAADLDSAAGRDVVRDFLATLGEGGQP